MQPQSRLLTLLADDRYRGSLALAARLQGFQVSALTSGRSALAHPNLSRFDAALVDLEIPDIAWEELLRGLRSANPKITMLVAVGRHQLEQVPRAMELGAAGHTLKPLDLDRTLKQVASAIQLQTQAAAGKQAPQRPRQHTPARLPQLLIAEPAPAPRLRVATPEPAAPTSTPAAPAPLPRRRTEATPAPVQQEGEVWFRALTEAANDAIIVVDRVGIVSFWNGAAEAVFGYPAGSIIGRPITAVFPRGVLSPSDPGQGGVAVTGESRLLERAFEAEGLRSDGIPIPVELSVAILRTKDGESLVVIARDVGDRRRAERSLRDSELRFRSLTETAKDAIVTSGLSGDVVFWNNAAVSMFGYTAEEIVGLPLSQVLPVLDDGGDGPGAGPLATGESRTLGSSFETDGVRKGGSRLPVEVSLATWKTGGGVFFTAIVRDITDRKQAEEALRASETRFRMLTKSASDAIVSVDREGRIVFWNDAAGAVFGYHGQEILRQPLSRLLFEDPAEVLRAGGRQPSGEFGAAGVPRRVETMGVRKDGSTVPIELSVAQWKAGGQTYLTVIIRDITERREAERRTQDALTMLKQALQGTVRAVSAIGERRDPYTAGHQNRVAQLAGAIAAEMELEEDRAEGLRVAATLHDIGKIYLPMEILNKPGRLSELEFSLIQTHPTVGYEIVEPIDFPWPVADIVVQHHERLDGKGYPNGLSAEDILLESRILSVADVIEAMASHRPYRPAKSFDEALAEIESGAGTRYDPEVVEACKRTCLGGGFTFDPTP